MISCGHDKPAYGAPLCVHMRTCRQPWLKYVKWYTGQGLTTEFICVPCAEAREKGQSVEVEPVCKECFRYAIEEVCDLERAGGQAEIKVCPMPFDSRLKESAIPKDLGRIVDIAPINDGNQPIWLMLAEDGTLLRANTSNGDWVRVGSATPVADKPGSRHALQRHLHVSRGGEFAAVVNDYGRYGLIIDLRSGNVTLELDGGNYFPDTVPFSFAFVDLNGRVLAIHRTGWNRLDISDPSSGKLLSERGPTRYQHGEERPQHYLDYFHGALYASPGNIRILDDGWIWGPTGMVAIWELDRWQSENPWESEDGPTRWVCGRDGDYWNHGMAWINEEKLAVGGIGDDGFEMIDGARIFDITSTGKPGRHWRSDYPWPREVIAFAGPAGKFFCDGNWLYSSDQKGLSRWDLETGARTGHLDVFHPTHYHSGAGQLVQLTNNKLVQWSMLDNTDSLPEHKI